jgi:hypothetical protein
LLTMMIGIQIFIEVLLSSSISFFFGLFWIPWIDHSWSVCHNDVVIGAICCRLEPNGAGAQRLYIMVLGLFAPYREYDVGSCNNRYPDSRRTLTNRFDSESLWYRRSRGNSSFYCNDTHFIPASSCLMCCNFSIWSLVRLHCHCSLFSNRQDLITRFPVCMCNTSISKDSALKYTSLWIDPLYEQDSERDEIDDDNEWKLSILVRFISSHHLRHVLSIATLETATDSWVHLQRDAAVSRWHDAVAATGFVVVIITTQTRHPRHHPHHRWFSDVSIIAQMRL